MEKGSRIRIGWLLSLIPAGVLFYAAILKGLDPALFADQITGHKVTPASWSPVLAHLFIAIELTLAFALLLRIRPRWTQAAFAALMLVFIGVTTFAWAHGNTRDCGCFGRAVSRGPRGVIVEDGILIAVAAAAFLLSRGARTPRWGAIAGAVAFVATILFTTLGGRIPADALVTGVHRGSDLSDVAIEDLRKPQSQGIAFLVLIGDACPACDQGVADLSGVPKARPDVNLAAVFSGTRQEAVAWRLRRLPPFPVAHASPRALRAYYRTLPTCFLLRDGKLVRAWWGRIPGAAEMLAALPPAQPS